MSCGLKIPSIWKKKAKYKRYDIKLGSIKRTNEDDAFEKLKKEAWRWIRLCQNTNQDSFELQKVKEKVGEE